MAPNTLNSFENISFNPFSPEEKLLVDDNDPDQNFYNDTGIGNYETPYMYEDKVMSYLKDLKEYENLSLLHLNIRSIQANFENFHHLLEESNFSFNIICLSETWITDKAFRENSCYHIQNYDAERKSKKKGGGVLIYVRSNLMYKIRNDVTDNHEEIQVNLAVICG